MANEDLIYRITRAVYDRLGSSANDQLVEQLVTDVYREVQAVDGARQPKSFGSDAPVASGEGSSSRMGPDN